MTLTHTQERVLNYVLAVLASIALVATAMVTSAKPAAAGDNCTLGVYCGVVTHGNDTGYDPDILIRCDYNVPRTNHRLPEGKKSSSYCRDTDQIGIRAGEELWCKYWRTSTYGTKIAYWKKTFDAKGWHQIHNDFRRTCVLKQD